MRAFLVVCFFIATITAVPSANAVSIPITNPGFESDILAAGSGTSTAPTGWSNGLNLAPNGIAYHPTTTDLPGGAPQGQNIGEVIGAGTAAINLFQNVGTVSAGTYSLSYDVVNLVGAPSVGYQVQLFAKSGSTTTVLGTDNNSQWPVPAGQYKPASLSVTVGAASPTIGATLGIRLLALGGSTSSPTVVFFDNLNLQLTPVPEPGTAALLVVGACLLFAPRIVRRTRR